VVFSWKQPVQFVEQFSWREMIASVTGVFLIRIKKERESRKGHPNLDWSE